jgi:hypothetical protein
VAWRRSLKTACSRRKIHVSDAARGEIHVGEEKTIKETRGPILTRCTWRLRSCVAQRRHGPNGAAGSRQATNVDGEGGCCSVYQWRHS